MQTQKGTRGFSSLFSKYSLKAFILLLPLFLFSNQAIAATTQVIAIVPGNTYTGSAAPSLGSATTQVAGQAFYLDAFCYNDGDNLPRTLSPQTMTLSSPGVTSTFTPSAGFTLPSMYGTLPNNKANSWYRNVQATLSPSGNSTVAINCTATGGFGSYVVYVPVQRIDHFTFTALPTFAAGTSGTITIEARDASNALCSTFNDTTGVQLTALDAGVDGATVNLGNLTFTNGVATLSPTFYHASTIARFRVYKSSSPTVETYQAFTINPGTFNRLLIIGPGQTIRSGENGGNGRASVSNTITAQTAGTNFTLTVYACDAYWNTRTAGGESVSLTCPEDPAFTYNGATAFGGGASSVVFNACNLHTVGDGYLLMTASDGTHASNTDIVRLNPTTTLASFSINSIGDTTAYTIINLTIRAYDAYGNSMTTVAGTNTFETRISGSAISNANGAWVLSPATVTFTSGVYTGTLRIRKASVNYTVYVSNGSVNVTSNSFTISALAAARYLVVMPGQSYTPGENFGSGYGRSGSPSPRQAGTPFNVSIIATDNYGNQTTNTDPMTLWSGTNSTDLLQSDSGASVSPNPIVLSNGSAYPAFTLTRSYNNSQDLGVRGTLSGLTSSGYFTVYHSQTVDHFSINPNGTSKIAGTAFSTVITAEDQYYNPVTDYAGTIYVTCPDLDYTAPTESVLRLSVGTPAYSSNTLTAYWTIVGGFTAGVRNFNTTIYRAGSSTLFVSNNSGDRPGTGNSTGKIGQTSSLTVAAAGPPATTMFAIVPGLTHRPGGIDASGSGAFAGDGYTGTPLSQQIGSYFSITVYATDDYWNVVSNNDQVTTTTSPSSSSIHGQSYTLSAGYKQINVSLNAETDYSIRIDDTSSPGIDFYLTPYTIFSFGLDHFIGTSIPAILTAGVPVYCTITAYVDAGSTVATTFTGSAKLTCTLDHNSTLQVVTPQSITFTAGVWEGNITVYRSSNLASTININFGNINNIIGSTFNVTNNTATKMLIVEYGGMSYWPGIAPDIDPVDSFGIQGQPAIQTAGDTITKIDFMLCDSYWNQVTQTAEADGTATITCPDPYPATIGATPFVSGSLTVNLVKGKYSANNSFKLFTVNGTSGQSISLSNPSGRTPYTLGVQKNRVPVKHALANYDTGSSHTRFRFVFTPTTSVHATAGVPFAVTVVAIDAYGNTLDSINGAAAMSTYKEVALSAQTDVGNKSIWPTKVGTLESTRWQEGKSYPWVYCFKEVTGSQWLTATTDFGNGSRSGNSHNFSVDRNVYARVVPWITGMLAPNNAGAGGTYIYSSLYDSRPPSALASTFNNFGTPAAHTAGNVVTLYAYSCDIYGNTAKYPLSYIHMSSSDRYAPNTLNYKLNPLDGFADFTGNTATTFRFHTHGTQTITVVDANVATITAGTTPSITVNPGAFYGLQAIAPGLIAIEGSGNTNVSGILPVGASGWFNGVTPQNPAQALNSYNGSAQFSGVYFPVSIQSVDMYGNFVSSAPSHTIELRSDDLNSNSEPNTSIYLTKTLSSGIAHFFCQQRTDGPRSIKPYNMSDITVNMHDGDSPDNSSAIVRIVPESEVDFRVYVEGVLATDNTPVIVDAYPNTFNARIEVRYRGTGEIVSTVQSFVMEPSTTYGSYTPPTSGALGMTAGSTLYGYADIINQSYNRAQNIYIRVRDAGGSSNPSPGYSPEIRVRASAPARIVLTADTGSYQRTETGTGLVKTIYQIQANASANVNATVYDANENPVPNTVVNFEILEQALTTSTLAPAQASANSSGIATSIFAAGAQNREHTIRASVSGVSADLIMFVTVTKDGGVYPNPFNPLQGQVVHIDFTLEQDARTKIEIYTLLGDLVWTKEIAIKDEGGHAGVNSVPWNGKNTNGVTVANGGYICVIKADDQVKKRYKIGVYKEK